MSAPKPTKGKPPAEREPTAAELKRIIEESKQLEVEAAVKRRKKAAEREREIDKVLAESRKTAVKKESNIDKALRLSLETAEDDSVTALTASFDRGEDITGDIHAILVGRGPFPISPVGLLQNTAPPTICYMNACIQCLIQLPGFADCDSWRLGPPPGASASPERIAQRHVVEGFQGLVYALKLPTPQVPQEQNDFLMQQAHFIVSMYELTRGLGENAFRPLQQDDSFAFQNILIAALTNECADTIRFETPANVASGVRAGGFTMLEPLAGTFRVNGGSINPLTLGPIPAPISGDANPDGLYNFFHERINGQVRNRVIENVPNVLIIPVQKLVQQADGSFRQNPPCRLIQRFNIADYYPAPEGSPQWQPANGGSTWYDLRAVLNHHGSTPNGGHYTASICYDIATGDWVEMDDIPPSAKYVPKIIKKVGERVETVSEKGKLPPTSKNALILYYVRELLPEEVGPRWASADDAGAGLGLGSAGLGAGAGLPAGFAFNLGVGLGNGGLGSSLGLSATLPSALPSAPPAPSAVESEVEPYPNVNANDFDPPEFEELSPELQAVYETDEAFTAKYNKLIREKISPIEVKRVFLMNRNQLFRKLKELNPRALAAVETLIAANNIPRIVDVIFKKMAKDLDKVTRRRQRKGRKHTRKLRL